MRLPLYQVDAFTTRVFGGNPAAVCPLDAWLDDARLQAIALENNLSETAYFVPRGDDYELRWFTPAAEIDLCGHATLATAFVVFTHLRPELDTVRFHTKSGPVSVARQGEMLELDFPLDPPRAIEPVPGLAEALGCTPLAQYAGVWNRLVVCERERDVRDLVVDMGRLLEVDIPGGVIVTAPGDEVDFVSRFFAPAVGVPEDPVTGSAHCLSTPYWAEKLGRNPLRARQISARGGELRCEIRGDRVAIAGHAVPYLRGEIEIPD